MSYDPFNSIRSEKSMPVIIRDQRAQIGCGTLLLIALIVMFFSRSNTQDIERELRGLRSEVAEMKKLIEVQSAEIRQLRQDHSLPESSPPSAKTRVEKAGQ
jgi:hypothetical protein